MNRGAGADAAADELWLAPALPEAIEALRRSAAGDEATARELALLGSLEEMVGRPTAALEVLAAAIRRGSSGDDTDESDLFAAEAAAAQLGALRGRSGNWGRTVTELGRAIESRETSPRLTRTVQGLRVRHALRQPEESEIDEAVAAAGCLTRWRAAGPFGARPLLSFDDAHEPALPGPWRTLYELGPGRSRGETFAPVVSGCDVELSGPLASWGGTTYAVTHVDLAEAQEVVLALDTLASARLFINDSLVLTLDRRGEYLPAVGTVRVWLPSGRSKVVVALTTRSAGPFMALTLTDGAGHPVARSTTALSPAGYNPAAPRIVETEETDAARGATLSFLAAHLALDDRDTQRVRRLLADGPAALRDSAPGLVMAAMSWAGDSTVPYDVARNRALALLRRARELLPAAWRPYYELSRFDADEERFDDALAVLRQGLEQAPEQPALWMLHASLLTTRGLWSESAEAVDRVAALTPGSCEAQRARYALAQGRRRQAEAEAAAQELASCDRESDVLARVELAASRWESAIDELRRLIARRGPRPLLTAGLAEALRGQGSTDEETDVLEGMLERNPEDRAALIDLVDLDVAAGRTGRAAERLARSAALNANDNLAERRLRALLSRGELLAPFRIDGRRIITEFEAEATSYEEPSVLVLDRTVFRVYPDGSVVELTHAITRVQAAEGIELEGEFQVPRGAALLTIRTIKADGTILEPEDIEGKSSLSLPNLEVGDYVETEYLRGHEPPPEFPDGVWPWRFYFQGFQRAFHHSELLVVAPTERRLDLSWRGEALEEQSSTVGALQLRRWVARNQGTLPVERDGPNRNEFVPSLLVSAGATWELYRETLAEALVNRDRLSDELRTTAMTIADESGAESLEQLIEALYRWVAEHVQDGGDPLAQVSHMLAARTGERTRITAALARALGIEVALGFARSSYADQTDDPVPALSVYTYPVFRVGSRWYYVGERARWAPACYMPPDLRGQRVLMQQGEELFTTIADETDDESCQQRARTVARVQMTLAADGTAAGQIEEQFHGREAVRWRGLLSRTPEDERMGMFEEDYVADVLPGAVVTNLEIQNEAALSEALIVTYRISGLRLGESPSEGTLRLLLPYQSELASGFASLPSRRTALVIHAPQDETVTFEISLPDGATAQLPPPVQAIDPRGEYRLTAPEQQPAGAVRLERHISLHPGRVESERYTTWSSFCREVDRSEQQPITVTLASAP